jgi:uncharacterized protein YecT (DUF1311 family)
MLQLRTVFLSLCMTTLVSPSMAAVADPCAKITSIIEGAECRAGQLNDEEKKQKQYFDAAVKRAALFDLDVKHLNDEQLAWAKYRGTLCGNVYLMWVQGTARYEMAALCDLKLTRERTYDLWRSYLTYVDSTPPILPDPRQ